MNILIAIRFGFCAFPDEKGKIRLSIIHARDQKLHNFPSHFTFWPNFETSNIDKYNVRKYFSNSFMFVEYQQR